MKETLIAEVVKIIDSVTLGGETPPDYRKAIKALWLTAFSSHPTVKLFLQSEPQLLQISHDRLLEGRELDDSTLEEAKLMMDEFNLPPRTRKTLLLSLLAAEWIVERIDTVEPSTTFPDAICSQIGDLCSDDFEGKLLPNTPQNRKRFLFLLVNYLVQYNAKIYPTDIGWRNSRNERRKKIVEEKKSGQKFMTIFHEI